MKNFILVCWSFPVFYIFIQYLFFIHLSWLRVQKKQGHISQLVKQVREPLCVCVCVLWMEDFIIQMIL